MSFDSYFLISYILDSRCTLFQKFIFHINYKMQKDNEPNKQEKQIEMFEIDDQRQVGTQVFDQNMPSDLNFDEGKKSNQLEPTSDRPHLLKNQARPLKESILAIQQYTIRGKPLLRSDIQYPPGSIIRATIPTYQVKAYSEQHSNMFLKNIWERVVGYTKRQFYFNEGVLYLLQETKQGLFVHFAWPFENIFKIFPDNEEKTIRFVIKSGQTVIPKDFQVQNVPVIMEKIFEESKKIGIKIE